MASSSSRPSSPKPPKLASISTSNERLDDDVILYMDELPSASEEVATVREADSDLHNLDQHLQSTPDYMKPESITLVHASGSSSRRSSLDRGTARITRILDNDAISRDFKVEYGGPVDEERDVETLEPSDEHDERRHNGKEHYPGVDDGLLESGDDDDDDEKEKVPSAPRHHPNEAGPAFIPGFVGLANSPPPDMNVYQQKKTIAQGMMDLALISANANQFRYVLQSSDRHPFYYASLTMIGLSLFLQIVVGIGLIWNSRYNVKVDDQMCKANRANNWTVIAIFLVTILNVFISSFGIADNSSLGFPSSTLTRSSNSTTTE